MPKDTPVIGKSNKIVWAGRIISALPVLLMGSGGVMALVNPAPVRPTFTALGYPAHLVPVIAVVEVICAILYAMPQTAVLGAILLTGYLGGATASHVRVGQWLFILPVAVGVLVWMGLYLRDARVRFLIPWRKVAAHSSS
ncbi:MAG: DoxX family protein [Phycisphaerae bacterium]|nr:DoxX family protein [Phycisphaerae bacterium]